MGSGVALGVGLRVTLDVGVKVLGGVTTAMRVGGNVGIGVGVGKTGCTRVGTTVGTAWSANRVGSSLAFRRFGLDPGVADRIAGTGVTDASACPRIRWIIDGPLHRTSGAQPERKPSAFKRTKEQSNGQLMSVDSRDGMERKFRGRLSGRI